MPGWFSRAKARAGVGGGRFRVIFDAQLGIGEGAVVALVGIGANPMLGILGQGLSAGESTEAS